MSEQKITFNFKETEADQSKFQTRLVNFLEVTNPKYFFQTDAQLVEGIDTVKKFKKLAAETPQGNIQVTPQERESIIHSVKLMNSSTNDAAQIVARPWRMSGFVPMNIPILLGMLTSPPTMKFTVFWQWMNQSYNAGMNFGNKNSTCTYTNTDLIRGYCAAIGSSVSVALGLRMLTKNITKTATGRKLLLINTFVACTATGTASFCNCLFMRYAEMEQGIDCFEDETLTKKIGVSKKCAESAVMETSYSRAALGVSTLSFPTALILSLGVIGINPQGALMAKVLEGTCIGIGLRLCFPVTVSIFPPISEKKGEEVEAEFNKYKNVYFAKGL